MNPYLIRLRKQYDGLRTSIEGLQTRAANEDRDLTDEELRSVTEMGEQAKELATQIENLTEIETRSQKVASLASQIDENDEQTRTTNAKVNHRDPGHYTRSSEYSFFNDIYAARAVQDEFAQRRLLEHHRALTSTAAGSGIVPPKWLTDEYADLARQGRALANAVRNVPLGNDPRPFSLPKQVTGADSTNPAEQTNENDATPSTDKFDTDVDTVTPKPTRGEQIVSRQTVEMSNPAVDALIYGDMLSEYNRQIESKVGAAVVTASGAAAVTFANEAAFTATAAVDGVVDLATAVRSARKLAPDLLVMGIGRWGKFKKFKDGSSRPLIPFDSAGPVNVVGVGSVLTDGVIEGLAVIVTDGIAVLGTYPESFVAMRAADTILFESDEMRFRYEEKSGPESIIFGIWRYSAVLTRYAGSSSKRAVITLA